MTNNDSRYTDPELRTEIKENIHNGEKGGKPGQWSARKAQMMASEYKKAMEERGEEPYTTDKKDKDDRQKNLTNWTAEEWQTSDGKAEAKQADGTEKRYLPKEAWAKMTEEEKNETNEAKLEGGKHGKQFVSNTDAAKAARKDASNDRKNGKGEGEESLQSNEVDKDSEMDQNEDVKDSKQEEESHNTKKRSKTDEDDEDEKPSEKGQKDSHPKKKLKPDGDEQKENAEATEKDDSKAASKDDADHGKPGSTDRLPEEGQAVHWRVASAWCEGTVLEVLYEEKEVAGRTAKATQNDPRIVVKNTKSGKSAVHKPGAVHF